jgi:hypothetical protein
MKLHLKYIVTLVITALVCIFAYQAYWLVGLYQSQEKEVEAKIKLCESPMVPSKSKIIYFIIFLFFLPCFNNRAQRYG